MEQTSEVIPEIAAKVIGVGERRRFFSSLAEALRAFLEERISGLIILGELSLEFSRSELRILRVPGEFYENFIEAPIVPLKVMGWNEKMTYLPNFNSLTEGFEAFWIRRIQGLQIYEQKAQKGGFLHLYTNYMVILSWDEKNPEWIHFHIHNVDVKDRHFWGERFIPKKHKGIYPFLGVKV